MASVPHVILGGHLLYIMSSMHVHLQSLPLCPGCCLITNKAFVSGAILIVAVPFWTRAFYRWVSAAFSELL